MNDAQRCGNCDFYDRQVKVCRKSFKFTLPKNRVPLGVKLERVKMEVSDGAGCMFWELDKDSWKG